MFPHLQGVGKHVRSEFYVAIEIQPGGLPAHDRCR